MLAQNGSIGDSPTTNGQLHEEKVAILDCGAQYGKLIDRKVRELNVESHILPLNTLASTIVKDNYRYVQWQLEFSLVSTLSFLITHSP